MYLILIIAGTVVFDQLVKHIVSGAMIEGQTIPVINNFFHITYIHNDGAAFGIMAGKAIFLMLSTQSISVMATAIRTALKSAVPLLKTM